MSGKVPHNKPRDQHNEMRHYIRHATLAPDSLLITAGDSNIYTPGQKKNKIIVPHNVAPRLLYHLHNKSPGQHPSMSHLESPTTPRLVVSELLCLLSYSEAASGVCSSRIKN